MAFSSWIRNWKRSFERRWALYQTLRRKSVARHRAARPRLEALEDRWVLSTIYTVTSTADTGAAGTLRDAINQANLGTYSEIDFDIGASGSAQTINLTSQLPTLTATGVYINGLSQGGSGNTTRLITLNGSGAGNSDGLLVQGTSNTVSGLIIESFQNNGIEIQGANNLIGGTSTGAGNVISGNVNNGVRINAGVTGVSVQGNYIGTDAAGSNALANSIGIDVIGSNNTIGGTISGAGNVISGNSSDGILVVSASNVTIQGNYIGTDATGSKAIANGVGILANGSNTTIGGTSSAARNIISGNTNQGLSIGSAGMQVLGNYIGTDVTGTKAIANSIGVQTAAPNNTIGGTVSGAGNVISGNKLDGVFIGGASGVQVLGNWIGTDSSGTKGLGNSIGVEVDISGNAVGGTAAGAGNVISGNTVGVIIDSGVTGVQVQGNLIGTDFNGTKGVGNVTGVEAKGSSNTIGGTTASVRNIISGNSGDGVLIDGGVSGIQVQGNYIGTDKTGTTAVANSVGVEAAGSTNTIGGTTSSTRNILSGNSNAGVLIDSGVSGIQVQGNYIGTDLNGTQGVGNSIGVLNQGTANTIGGTTSGARNIISGNTNAGVSLLSSSKTLVAGNYIGTDVNGSTALGNSIGISANGSLGTIGGTTTAARNVISGNTNVGILVGSPTANIWGNFIGTDLNGTKGVGNSIGIETTAPNITIGGTAAGTGNVISGNSNVGVLITGASGVVLQGNLIGTDTNGTVGVGNSIGVEVSASGNIVGGSVTAARNIISGNSGAGVLIDSGVSGVQVQGDYIGTNSKGAGAVANGVGVSVAGSGNTIGGTTSAVRNIISGNSNVGVFVGASGVTVQGNYIGTDATGATAVANGTGVMESSSDNTIGGTTSGTRNIISGNGAGVVVNSGVSGIQVQGNYIGTDATGATAVANAFGVEVFGANNTIGGTSSTARNIISGNSNDGVFVATSSVQVIGNYIGTDVNGAKAVANSVGIEVTTSGNTIGGTATGAGDLISGNSGAGVQIDGFASGVQVQGNYIGTDSTGASAVANSIGVLVEGSGSTIGGTTSAARNIISGNSGDGVVITSGVSGVQVQGNYIGTNTTGAGAIGNGIGIAVGGSNNTIGGTTAGTLNVISGNTEGVHLDASGVSVQGNYIGTDSTGTVAVANNIGVRVNGSNNTVGGTTNGAINVISGNSGEGVLIDSGNAGVQIQGNYIGTDLTGTSAVANSIGVLVEGSNNTIGGTTTAARNIISGNSGDGVVITSGASGVQVQGNYIGTDLNGTKGVANAVGVLVQSSFNTIGGSTSAASNVISGNTADGVLINNGASSVSVQVNTIGTDPTGTLALSNIIGVEVGTSSNVSISNNLISGNTGTNAVGVQIDSGATGASLQGNFIGTNVANSVGIKDLGNSTTIGGTAAGSGNLISGNTNQGVLLQGSGGLVLGNFIGTNATGSGALANSVGIEVNASAPNTIGGTAAGARNIISGNTSVGVKIDNVSGAQVLGNYIGTDVTGKNALANSVGIQDFGHNNTIGGSVKGAGNVLSGNGNDGILLDTSSTSETLQGNYIGLDVTGKTILANARSGVEVRGTSNTIGGNSQSNYFTRNFISGNSIDGVAFSSTATGNVVQGNFIGLDISGTKAAGNVLYGIEIGGSSNTIGGTTAGIGNFISGNKHNGMLLDSTSSSNVIQGNDIGTDYAGKNAVANSIHGIEVMGIGNTLGGSVLSARNIISGNIKDGILLDSGATGNTVQGNYIGINISSAALANSVGIEIVSNGNTIGGTVSAARNIVSGNGNDGVKLDSTASGNLLLGNYVGTSADGTTAVANKVGLEIAGTANTIGGTAPGTRNLFSGNSTDGLLIDASASGNLVLGNFVGLNVPGNALGNGTNGIEVKGTANTLGGTIAGARNVISANSNDGVLLASTASGNQVLGNFVGTNNAGTLGVANKVGIEDAGNNNTLGGSVLGARNVISGNTTNGILMDSTASSESVQGNYIGLDPSGKTALANGTNGIEIQGALTVGGNSQSNYFTRNFISGNANDGLKIDNGATGNQVQGNFIGLDTSGTKGVANLANGIEIAGNSNTVGGTTAGLGNFISGNKNAGVLIDSTASSNVIQGNDIGTDYKGLSAVANSGHGIEIVGTGNTVGGSVSGARNIISGNSKNGVMLDSAANGTVIQGNYIGINVVSTALGNANGIEIVGVNNTVGGTASGARNVISGNSSDGLLIDSTASGITVLGNYVGTSADGTTAVANNGSGIEIAGTANVIGGTASGSRNVLSGNSIDGVVLDSTASGNTVLGNFVGLNAFGTALGNSSNGIEVKGTANTLGGTAAAARNVISANSNDGVLLASTASGNQVLGNFIGTDNSGTVAMANSVGIEDAGNHNTLGGSVLGARNVISGNTANGILLDSTATADAVQGNYLGLDLTGKTALANGSNGIEIQGTGSTIGGNSQNNINTRNYISGNTNDGVLIDNGATGNQVQGNFIGLDTSGTRGVGNLANGIEIAGNSNTIGGTTAGLGNVVSGNSTDGLRLDSLANNNLAQGNFIGTDYTGTSAVGNGGNGATIVGNNNTIGGSVSRAGNTIANNTGDGVLVSTGIGNIISRNSTFSNAGGGIALTNGGNNNLAAPSLTSSTFNAINNTLTVTGSFTPPTANVPYVLEFFANPVGDAEGKIYLGSLTVTPTTTNPQSFTFNTTTTVTLITTNPVITATLTDATDGTSAFSTGVTTT